MGLRIATNIASLAAQRAMRTSQRQTEGAMKQLATGSRFSDITEGAADFAIAEHLRGQIKGMGAARMNADNAISFVQVAEGGLNEQNNILIRQRELAIQAASDTFSDNERGMMDLEFQQLGQEFDRIAKTTSFGSQNLLDGTEKEYVFQVGAYGGEQNRIRYLSNTNTTTDNLNLSDATVADKGGAEDVLNNIDEALGQVAQARANFGAIQSRLQSVSNNASVQMENLEAARSRIEDTDVAETVSKLVQGQALQQYQLAVLAQANQLPGQVVKLIA